jgi:transcription factor CP2 and related proteins
MSPVLPSSPSHVPSNINPMMPFAATPIAIANVSSTNGLCKIDQNVVSTQNYDIDDHLPIAITKDTTPQQLMQWLNVNRLSSYSSTFTHFSGCDVLRYEKLKCQLESFSLKIFACRMSKDDLIQICGLADGIRMFNILHVK